MDIAEISSIQMVFMCIVAVVCTLGPLAAAIIVGFKLKTGPLPLVLGIMAFLVSQFLLRTQFLQLLFSVPAVQSFMQANETVYFAFLSLTAGLFEEFARLAVFVFFLKSRLDDKNAIAYGVGHGGVEVFMITGLGYIDNFISAQAINAGIAGTLAPDVARDLMEFAPILASITIPQMLAAVLERAAAMVAHITFSLIVARGIKRGKMWPYLWTAVGLHFAMNFVAVLLAWLPYGLVWSEAFIVLFALGGLYYMIESRRREGDPAK